MQVLRVLDKLFSITFPFGSASMLLQSISFHLEVNGEGDAFRETDKNRKIGMKINLCGFQHCAVRTIHIKIVLDLIPSYIYIIAISFYPIVFLGDFFPAPFPIQLKPTLMSQVLAVQQQATHIHIHTFSPYAPFVYMHIFMKRMCLLLSQHFVAVDGYEFYLSS